MSNLWDYNGAHCIGVNDYGGLKKYLKNHDFKHLIKFTHYTNVAKNRIDWSFSICHGKEDYFINHFDPSDCEVEEFLKGISKFCEDFEILVFDYYARYEDCSSWFKLINKSKKLKIIQMELKEVKQ